MSAWRTWRQASCWFRALSTIPGGPPQPSRSAPRTRPGGHIRAYSTSTSTSTSTPTPTPASPSEPPPPPEDPGAAPETTDAVPPTGPAEPAGPSAETRAPTKQAGTHPTFAERLMEAPMPAHPSRASILVRPWVPLPDRAQSSRSAHQHRQSVISQARYQEQRQRGDRPFADWRVLLQRMADNTPSRATWKTVVLQADTTRFSKRLLYDDMEKGIRAIRGSTGCSIRDKMLDDRIMSISINGPPDLLERAVAAVLETIQLAVVSKGLDDESYDGPAVTRIKHSELRISDRSHLRRVDAKEQEELGAITSGNKALTRALPPDVRTAQELPTPKVWTKQSLNQYVARITDVHLEKLARSVPNPRVPHVTIVSNLLLELFNNHDARSSITLRAVHKALRYHVRHGMALRQEMLDLFDFTTKTLKLSPTTETFNIMLSSYAREKDLGGFDWIIRSMESYSCVPNFRTWLTLLYMIESGQVRQYVMGIMRDKGMLESPSVVRHLAELNASHHARAAMETEPVTRLQDFLDQQDRIYGKRDVWLTRRAGNKTVNVLCQHGRFQDAFALVEEMRQQGRPKACRPDIVTYTTILSHAKTQRLVLVGLHVVETMEQQSGVLPNDITYHLLFELLWHARMSLAVGVVWHHAALAMGSLSYRTRRRVGDVLHFLTREEPVDQGSDAAAKWARQRSLACLVSTLPDAATLPEPMGGERVPLDLLFTQKHAGWKPEGSFGQLLRTALEADYQNHVAAVISGPDRVESRRASVDLVLGSTEFPEIGTSEPSSKIRLEADYSSLIEKRQKAISQ